MIVHWLWHALGLTNGSGQPYLFWSGIFGDATIFAAAIGLWLHHTCHVSTCWRPGKHPDASGTYKLCRKHHPDTPDKRITVQHVVDAHVAAQEPGVAG